MRVTSVIGVVIVVAIMLVAIVLGTIYVYKDAKKRNMGAIKWAIIAFFYPLFTGVAAYMICRKPLIDFKCSKCGTILVGDEKVCPGCEATLLNQCPKCGFPVERGWKVCPQCGNAYQEEFARPMHMYRKDRGHIVTMVIVCVLIVAGFISLGMMPYFGTASTGTTVTGMGNITATDLSKNKTIAKWIKDSDESDRDVHILMQKNGGACIVYAKNNNFLMSTFADVEAYDDGHSEIIVHFDESEFKDKYGYDFFLYEFDIKGEIEFDVRFGGFGDGKGKAKVTTTSEDISQSTWRESNVGE